MNAVQLESRQFRSSVGGVVFLFSLIFAAVTSSQTLYSRSQSLFQAFVGQTTFRPSLYDKGWQSCTLGKFGLIP